MKKSIPSPKKKQRENLENYKDQAFLSRELVTIKTDAPVSWDQAKFRVVEPDRRKLSELFKDLEFRQLQQSFPEQADLSRKDYQAILTMDQLSVLIQLLE